MIGVVANLSDHAVVREFFELFKTRWEFYRAGSRYDVVLIAGDFNFDSDAKLTICYAAGKTQFDGHQDIQVSRQREKGCQLSYAGKRIPIYGESVAFVARGAKLLNDTDSQECAGFVDQNGPIATARIGYDIFVEVRTLLTVGQPSSNAHLPALELHIALLRDLITGCGISLVEIPPVPEGHQFIASLTHDVDHPSIRLHKWDRTVFGFLLRAIFGSLVDFVRRRISLQDVLSNWAAACKLPFVYTGLIKDFWLDFDDRYREMENSHRSTFFVIPFKNRSGRKSNGAAPGYRASGYGADDIADTIRSLTRAGSEIGLHGIDAWLDSTACREELKVVARLTGESEIGVRMHWLYYDDNSPATLEKAGVSYDSTIGYNVTVGYRAGTTQAFKPFGAERLLELPVHAMDTALFYLSYLGLSPQQASSRLRQMADVAAQYGGCCTINWHDRSLSPERLWGGCYRELIRDLEARGAWFATAREAVAWFRKRRSAEFEDDPSYPNSMRVKFSHPFRDDLPGLLMRIYKERAPAEAGSGKSAYYVEMVVPEGSESHVPLNVAN